MAAVDPLEVGVLRCAASISSVGRASPASDAAPRFSGGAGFFGFGLSGLWRSRLRRLSGQRGGGPRGRRVEWRCWLGTGVRLSLLAVAVLAWWSFVTEMSP